MNIILAHVGASGGRPAQTYEFDFFKLLTFAEKIFRAFLSFGEFLMQQYFRIDLDALLLSLGIDLNIFGNDIKLPVISVNLPVPLLIFLLGNGLALYLGMKFLKQFIPTW